jgi:hypothetical protein
LILKEKRMIFRELRLQTATPPMTTDARGDAASGALIMEKISNARG